MRLLSTLLLVAAVAGCPPVAAKTQVVIPLQLDYPLLYELLRSQLFTGPGTSLEVLNDPSGCSEAVMSAPTIAPEQGRLQLTAALAANLGIGAPGSCTRLLTWSGRIRVSGAPEIRQDGTALGFQPDEVLLLDTAGQRVTNDSLQAVARAGVRNALERFVVDLRPQLASVGDFLPSVLPRHSREQIEALVATLRVQEIHVREESVDAQISLRVDALPPEVGPEGPLSDEELARWEERWQLMDALLVLAVKHYAASTQLQELRDALLDALIESRYRLRDALTETPTNATDTVRDWFLQSWQSLTPIFRRIALEQPRQEHLLLLSVITAGDALDALDRVGPAVGVEISTDGLRRLARMINSDAAPGVLEYSNDLDPQLRRLFEASLGAQAPPLSWQLDVSLFPRAMAAGSGRLNSWAPRRQDLPEYLPMVGVLLNASAEKTSAARGLDPQYRELFRRLVLTTAWQESCWRHYVVSDERKLVPLRSGSGDVGLMQINERVWRGFYDQQRLRWDIDYNSEAGAEVLIDYLMRYAIRKGEHHQPGGLTNLARASYAAYNGGPSRLTRYRSSAASAYGRKVDALFWEKYQQVAAGNELAVSGCLGGNLSGPVSRRGKADVAPTTFSLQLGAFSSAPAAQALIARHGLGGAARVHEHGGAGSVMYLVLLGNYATRREAEAAAMQPQLDGLEPWIRPVEGL
jgi:hypothetical protein